jgi:hypothetical protein
MTKWRPFLTPVPHAASLDALNVTLEERCRTRQAECAGRHEQTIGERLAADRGAFRSLPAEPFEPCDKRSAKVSSTALVRYRMNDYSVPTAYGFRDVLVKGFVDEVVIICGANESTIWHFLSKSPARLTKRRPCRAGPCRDHFNTCGGS